MLNWDILENLKKALDAEKARLEKSLAGIARRDKKDASNWDVNFPQMGEGQDASSSMMEESADEVEEYETLLETEDALESRLRDVNRALDKMRDGAYGACENCSQPIPEERLRANPAARFDMEHEQNSL